MVETVTVPHRASGSQIASLACAESDGLASSQSARPWFLHSETTSLGRVSKSGAIQISPAPGALHSRLPSEFASSVVMYLRLLLTGWMRLN